MEASNLAGDPDFPQTCCYLLQIRCKLLLFVAILVRFFPNEISSRFLKKAEFDDFPTAVRIYAKNDAEWCKN